MDLVPILPERNALERYGMLVFADHRFFLNENTILYTRINKKTHRKLTAVTVVGSAKF